MNRADCVRYIDKSRDYYAAQGYEVPYRWAHFDTIPFAGLTKPLSKCSATVITTAMPDPSYVGNRRRLAIGDLGDPPAQLFTGDLAWDREATHTDDRETYFPVRELNRAVDERRLGRLAPRFFCAPTLYGAREIVERDAPAIVKACQDDGVDIALLVPL